MSAETFIISGTGVNINSILIIFFAAFFIYNASRLSISFLTKSFRQSSSFEVQGNTLSIVFCIFSIVILFGLLTACSWPQVLIFMATSLLSLFYMMPFKKNGVKLHGLRNNLFLKNIILALTWASATVIFPLYGNDYFSPGNEFIFMFIRRFFFIYALTVIYDLRDIEQDKKAGMDTIALHFGENVTKLWSLTALAFFVLFTYTDPVLSEPHTQILSVALLLSAGIAAFITLYTHKIRNKSWYSMAVDSAMLLQFLLVLVFHEI